MILYLHGFRSSPQSYKARLIGERMRQLGHGDEYLCPQLPASPRMSIELASRALSACPADAATVIGSSLGGYYATWLAEQTGCRAVLLNPAVRPARDLERQVGVTTAYHSAEPFEFRHAYIDELKAMAVGRISRPERYFLVAATGDEVLDWHEMVAHYPGARQLVIDGSDHGLSDFDQHVEQVLAFCGYR